MAFDRYSLRHVVATLAYRAAKTMRGAPDAFSSFRAGPSSKSPVEIVAHMGDLFEWALRMTRGERRWTAASPQVWPEECARFFRTLKALDDYLASDQPIDYETERIFAGPIADALTHTGQLAMLRRLSGAPMKGENYSRADILVGRISLDQTPANPKYEFD